MFSYNGGITVIQIYIYLKEEKTGEFPGKIILVLFSVTMKETNLIAVIWRSFLQQGKNSWMSLLLLHNTRLF